MKRSVIIWHVVFPRPGHTLELYADRQKDNFGIPGTLHVRSRSVVIKWSRSVTTNYRSIGILREKPRNLTKTDEN